MLTLDGDPSRNTWFLLLELWAEGSKAEEKVGQWSGKGNSMKSLSRQLEKGCAALLRHKLLHGKNTEVLYHYRPQDMLRNALLYCFPSFLEDL